MEVQKAANVGPSGIEIAYESFGDPGAPLVLLIMGLGSQMLGWHEGLLHGACRPRAAADPLR